MIFSLAWRDSSLVLVLVSKYITLDLQVVYSHFYQLKGFRIKSSGGRATILNDFDS